MRVKQMLRSWVVAIATLVAILLIQTSAIGGDSRPNPIAPPQTDSPRATLQQFVKNVNDAQKLIESALNDAEKEGYSDKVRKQGKEAEQAMERAVETLNLDKVAPVIRQETGIESALLLKEILDRLDLPDPNEIPDAEAVKANKITRWEVPHTELAIVLVEEGFNQSEFLFSPETIKRLKGYYKEIKSRPSKNDPFKIYDKGFYEFYLQTPGRLLPPWWFWLLWWVLVTFIPPWLFQWLFIVLGGQTLWQWLALLVSLAIASAIVVLIYQLIQLGKRQVESQIYRTWLELSFPIALEIVLIVWIKFINETINITGSVLLALIRAKQVAFFLILAWLSFDLCNVIGSTIATKSALQEKLLETTIIRNGFRILGIIAGAIVVYFGGKNLGIDTAPLLASLGVGGVGISFGVRPYIENIVGGITLFINRPMQIGDYCEFGGIVGTVEEIGLRATLIRTPDRKLITVPNTAISNAHLVNHSRRDKYAFKHNLSLSVENTSENLSQIMNNLRQLLVKHPQLEDERISLVDLKGAAVDLELFAYVLTTKSDEYRRIYEDLLLQIQQTVERLGI
ncbi:MAG: mechanosensitive ion channel family protein [Cyanobacteria bacterium SBLK]|nr:mechanosensitive ion channel family protein [Cyanobacteria bacterium SBLK]